MAISITIDRRAGARNIKINKCGYQTNENYPSGGFAVTANQFGLSAIDSIQITPPIPVAGTTCYIAAFNPITSRIQYYWVDTTVDGNPLVEVVNNTAIGLVFGTLIAYGV